MTWANDYASCGHRRSAIIASFCEHDGCYNSRKQKQADHPLRHSAGPARVEAELRTAPDSGGPIATVEYDEIWPAWVVIGGSFATGVLAGAVLVMVLVR